MRGRLAARLTHPQIETEVADQLLGRGEAAEIADRGDDRERDRCVDARDRYQPLHFSRDKSDARGLGVDQLLQRRMLSPSTAVDVGARAGQTTPTDLRSERIRVVAGAAK
jgi:hypothetical protein